MPDEPTPDPTLYVQPAEVAEALGISDSNDPGLNVVTRATKAASRAVEGFCRGRRFWLDTAPQERRLRTDDPQVLELRPDLAELTGLEVAGVAWQADEDFELEQSDIDYDNRPYVRAVTLGSRRWPTGRPARIQIAGRWGWPKVPDEVVQGAMLVAQRLAKRKDAPLGIASIPSWEGVGMRLLERFDADGTVLLHRYKWPGGMA